MQGADITARQVDKLQGASYYGITVQPADRLSDNVYHYDVEEHIFEKAQTHDERMQAKKAERECPYEKKSIMDKLAEKKKEAQALSGDKHSPVKAAENSL